MVTSDNRNPRVRFGNFEADLVSGQLFRQGQLVEIQRKPFQILELLLQSRGALVSREQIIDQVWPNVHVDQQHCLNTAIRKLRTALALNASTPGAIETTGSRGYRLCIPVEFPSTQDPLSEPPNVTLAVLPFQNLSGEDDAFFSDGLTEQMIAQLGRTCRTLSVIAPITSMRFRDTAKQALDVGRELKSNYLLCGSVLKGNQRFRITARLIRAEDQLCVWTDSYARNEADIFLVQDEITQQIARAIARTIQLPQEPNTNLTTQPAVYETFLRAGFYAAKGTEPAFIKAVDLYQQVIAKDANFAPAYANFAILWSEAGQYGVLPPKVVYERVRGLASHALSLSPVLPEANAALGFANLFFHSNFSAAESAFLRAMELNCSCISAYQGYGMLMSAMDRHDEAIAAMRHQRDLDPFSPMANALMATALCLAGRLPEAIEEAHHTVEIEPNFPTGHACIGWTKSLMGDYESTVRAFREALRRCPSSSLMMLHLAHGLALNGEADEAREILRKVLNFRSEGLWASPYWFALVHLGLGDTEAALHWLEIAVEECDGWRAIAASDQRLHSLTGNPCFVQLLKQIGKNDIKQSLSSSAGT